MRRPPRLRRFKQLNKSITRMRRYYGPSDFVLRLQAERAREIAEQQQQLQQQDE